MPFQTSNTTYKATLEGETRRFTLASPVDQLSSTTTTTAVDNLCCRISQIFSKHVGSLSWTDEDGDQISLKTDADLTEAVRAAQGTAVKLAVNSAPAPSPASSPAPKAATAAKKAPKAPSPLTKASATAVAALSPSASRSMPNFSASSSSIELTEDGILTASCKDSHGKDTASTLDLNKHVGNKNGKIDFNGADFGKSARALTLASSTLTCELRTISGQWVPATLNLDTAVENQNGTLVFVNTSAFAFSKWKGKSPAMPKKATANTSTTGTTSTAAGTPVTTVTLTRSAVKDVKVVKDATSTNAAAAATAAVPVPLTTVTLPKSAVVKPQPLQLPAVGSTSEVLFLRAHTGNNVQCATKEGKVGCANVKKGPHEEIRIQHAVDGSYFIQSVRNGHFLQCPPSNIVKFENKNQQLWEAWGIEHRADDTFFFVSKHTGNVLQCTPDGVLKCDNKNRMTFETFNLVNADVHRFVRCDKSGMNPIKGTRYHLAGANYDLCEAEFIKLSEEEKAKYTVINKPRSTPTPYKKAEGGAAAAIVEPKQMCWAVKEGKRRMMMLLPFWTAVQLATSPAAKQEAQAALKAEIQRLQADFEAKKVAANEYLASVRRDYAERCEQAMEKVGAWKVATQTFNKSLREFRQKQKATFAEAAANAKKAANEAAAAAAAAAVEKKMVKEAVVLGTVLHHGVVCDISGECPIQGTRYQMAGYDYDLCEAEFEKLAEEDKVNYVVIARPSDLAVPYTLPAAIAAAPEAVQEATPKAAPETVEIIRAWYGDPAAAADPTNSDRGADVTAVVQTIVANGERAIRVENGKLGCDPAVGVRKIMLVEYNDSANNRQLAKAFEREICAF
eukprot:gene7175-17692_t